ncbi:Fasciclin domain-containing protein [Chitinophaga eiseniae]|uniref:Fasciclin domain-containing protein n=1 Tax=Chitinophaga eiseniae TaxID=634771 RepID=A0A1T4M635_9BACT|nr:fasciclin domain-containing protein [Chitinophaga eiseniae]SJZ62382.1 Fasciclin domain-containing protein [Chitinophaga eiseniae]
MTLFTSFTIPGRLLRCCLPVLLLLAMACRKQDIEPEPVGEPVPYTGPVLGLKETLEKSPYTYFKTAWRRANIDTRLQDAGTASFTIFAPTDKAFEQAGWTLEKINQAMPETLDSLLSFHISANQVHPASLEQVTGNLAMVTLLKSASLPGYEGAAPYEYVLYAGRYHDSLYINGQPVSKWGQALESTTATIYPADKVLQKPTQDMLSFLQSDERFSFYLEACRINDSLYLDKNPWDRELLNMPVLSATGSSGGQFTLIVPTNEAFRKSGFNTIADIRQYNYKSLPIGDPDYDEQFYYRYPTTAMDSILLPNRMDYAGATAAHNGQRNIYQVYFSNELMVNKGVSGMLLRPGAVYNNAPVIYRLDFSAGSGGVGVKRLGSSTARLPLAEANICLLNGVVHVVNEGLFMP